MRPESEKDSAWRSERLQQVKLERQRLENEHARQRTEEAAEIEKLKMRLGALKADLENSQQNLLTVRAPYDAVVISLAQRNAGSVVQNGQELCQLARARCQTAARVCSLNEAACRNSRVGQRSALFLRSVSLSTLWRGEREA